MLHVMVSRAGLVPRKEARQGFGRLGEVHEGDHDQRKPGDERQSDEQTVVPHEPEHTDRAGSAAAVTKQQPTVYHDSEMLNAP